MKDVNKDKKKINTKEFMFDILPSKSWQKFLTFVGVVGAIFGLYFGLYSFLQEQKIEKHISVLLCIGAFIFLFLVFFAFQSTRRIIEQKKRLKQLEILEKMESTPEYLCTIGSNLFGLCREKQIINGFLGKDGSLETFEKTEIRATTDRIYSVESYITCPHIPKDTTETMEILAKSLHYSKIGIELVPEIINQNETSIFWKIAFVPALRKNQTIEYEYSQKAPSKAFAMTKKELNKRKMDCEFTSVRISIPAKYFKFRLTFPKNFLPPDYDYAVWLGDGQVTHHEEYNRVRENKFWKDGMDAKGLLFMELEVQYPIHGLTYALTWVPPLKFPTQKKIKG